MISSLNTLLRISFIVSSLNAFNLNDLSKPKNVHFLSNVSIVKADVSKQRSSLKNTPSTSNKIDFMTFRSIIFEYSDTYNLNVLYLNVNNKN